MAVFPSSSILSSLLNLVSDSPFGNRHLDGDILDRSRSDFQKVVAEHQDVAAFADLQRAGFMLFKAEIAARGCEHLPGLSRRKPLLRFKMDSSSVNSPNGTVR